VKVNWNQVVGIVAEKDTLCAIVRFKEMLKLSQKLEMRSKKNLKTSALHKEEQ